MVPWRTVKIVDRMPRPGDPYAQAFIAEVDKCWRVVHGLGGQATHCAESTTFHGAVVLAEG
jgi:hypothetical protein